MRHLAPAAFAALFLPSLSTAQADRRPEAFQIGLGLQQRGLHDEAARYFEQFLAQQPEHALAAEAHYRLGTSRAERGAAEPAIEALQNALQKAGADFALRPECRYRLGNLLEARGEHRLAVAQFTALAKEVAPDHYLLAAARFAEGEAMRELGDDARAAEAFLAAAVAATGERASFRFPALYQLGFAQLRQNQLGEAAATFAVAADAATDDAGRGECRHLAGDLLLRRGDVAAARAAFTAAVQLGGEFADDAQLGLGFAALQAGDGAGARREFERVVAEHPQSPLVPKAMLEIARSLYTQGSHGEAATRLQPLLLDGAPDDVRQQARELLGLCELAGGKGEAAVAALQQALSAAAAPDRPRLSFALGEAFANLSRWDDALAAYDAVPAEAPSELRGEALYGACFALHSLGRHADSTARARALLALEPPHRLRPQAVFAIAENLFADRDYAGAERQYEMLADDTAHRERAAWKLAWCRYLQGDAKAAAARFAALAEQADAAVAEEALSMQALALCESGEGDGALALADRYRVRYPSGAFLDRTERIAARVLRQRGDLAAAQKRLARAAQAAAATQALADQAEQAELAYLQGDFAAADALFEALCRDQGAVGARAAAGRAWCAFELGDDAGCAQRLGEAFAHGAAEAELPGLFELRSALAHRRQDWANAIAAGREFLQRFPSHGKAAAMRYALGTAEARSGDSAAARRTLGELVQAGGFDRMDRVHYELAWACRRDADEAAALRAFADVAAATTDEELAGEARLHLGTAALAQDDVVAARAHLASVRGSHRATALYRLAFAEFERSAGDLQQLAVARDLCAEIVALPDTPLRGEALYLGAECCHRLGDERGACERLVRLLTDAPQHERAPRAQLLLGECAVLAGDGAIAVPPLEAFLRGAGIETLDQARAHLWLGRARALRGEHDKAEASLQRVTELTDTALAAEAQFRIGEVRLARGDLNGAADAFVKLPILYGHAEWVRRGLLQAALAYEQLQQPAKARRFFRELLQQHADSEEAKAARAHVKDD
ncbi:MAG: tetratricopeptide repeat protein [Planctomycetes bacterium]|nr:tetratricopeptide repeat protein [Planctomycetota bacterium]